MSWSLQLTHGDFVLNGTSLATVTDASKLFQDLRCAILEHMGTDDMHPDYGSTIDGGRLPNGTVVPGVVGISDWNEAAATVHSELERIANNYQSYQLARAKSDRLIYGRATLTPGESLIAVPSIDFIRDEDTLDVTMALENAQGQEVNLVIPVDSGASNPSVAAPPPLVKPDPEIMLTPSVILD